MKTTAYLIGGGGLAGEVLDAVSSLRESGKLDIAGVFDDDTRLAHGNTLGIPYKGTLVEFVDSTPPEAHFIWAIGDNVARQRLGESFSRAGRRALAIVHPSATVSLSATIMEGSYVAASAFVGPKAVVGQHAIVNVGASVGHNATVGEFAQLCPGVRISGFCTVGRGAFLGSNSAMAPGKKIGDWAKLAACSFGHRDIPARSLAVGVPARVTQFEGF